MKGNFGTILHRSCLITLGHYIKHVSKNGYLCMSGNSKNDKVGIHPFGKIFEIEKENDLEHFLYENWQGIIYINLVKTANFHIKSLSDEARKMCEPGTNDDFGGLLVWDLCKMGIHWTGNGKQGVVLCLL